VSAPGITTVEEALALERNLALMAGAGAGKTWSLVALCLHVLGGARPGAEPLHPSKLVLVTFTEKAAGELQERLRGRLRALAAGDVSGEAVLVRTFERAGKPFPPPARWQGLLEAMGQAYVGTFHGLCVQLLRQAPAGLGVEPGFTLLDEGQAEALCRRIASRTVLEALESGNAEVAALCREWGFEGAGRGQGLVDALLPVFTRLREEGRRAAELPVTDAEDAVRGFEDGLREARSALAEAQLALAGRPHGAWHAALGELSPVLAGLSVENFHHVTGFPAVQRAISGARLPPSGAHKPALVRLKQALVGGAEAPGLQALWLALYAAPQERTVRALLTGLERSLAASFAREGVLDFTELLLRARNLLRDVPAFRAEVQGRVGALLVDECQDTNRVQLELVHLLAEEREGAPRPLGEEGPLALPLQPASVCAVGDRKQSIYEFRGADVAVFELLARSIEASGGVRAFLKDNRRSTPGLLAGFNHAFARVLRGTPGAGDEEVAYVPDEDDLRPVRSESDVGSPVERLLPPGEGPERSREADALARRIAALLAPGAPERIADREGRPRPLRGSDVALLFRGLTHLETYRQALLRHGIPHRVLGGRGFYAAQEILDVASGLAWVADPSDRASFAAVLRSPFVALTDAELYAVQERAGLSARRAREWLGGETPELTRGSRERLSRLLALHADLVASWDGIPLETCVRTLVRDSGYRVAAAALPGAEQVLANLQKLEELAAGWRGEGGLPQFARELLARAREQPREEQALTVDAGDTRAVQLLTVHRSKGLEWPVVVVPELGSPRSSRSGPLQYDRRVGLALRPVAPGGMTGDTERLLAVREVRRKREEAESRRLLYVALTRARDKVLLAGAPRRGVGGTWWHWLDAAFAEGTTPHVVDVPHEGPAPAPRPAEAPPESQPVAYPSERPRRTPPRTLVFPVTQLQDFFRCPRRYRYLHVLGLSEARISLEPVAEDGAEATPAGVPDARARGVLAHALLESLPAEALGDPHRADAAFAEMLATRGVDPEGEASRELRRELSGFSGSPLARRMASLGVDRVHRELPFVLRLESPDGLALHLRGQVDLLLQDEDGGATVIDYKYAERPSDPFHAYGFQLDCYALAARALVGEGTPVRTGLVFLRGGAGVPVIRQELPAGDPARLERALLEGAAQWARCAQGAGWPGIEPRECARLRCGFLSRCHPRVGGL
jgi:ATP-dependent exoDNAse (exonuclease V) beta subunit